MNLRPTCVLCDKEAVTTAAHIPVCEEHWNAYALEGRLYLPMQDRKVYLALLAAEAARKQQSPNLD
jgi:hypothetical protein